MAATATNIVEQPVSVDVPDQREYASESAAAVDASLCEAVNAAERANKDFLAQLLEIQIGTHYFETR